LDRVFKDKIKQRMDILNDPSEILESLRLKSDGGFDIEVIDETIKHLMERLEIRLPEKLMLPVTLFYLANTLSTNITVTDSNILFEFDPR
jgi:hypothetical protein